MPKAVKTTSTPTPTPPVTANTPPRRRRRNLATPADYAAVEFEPVLGLAEVMGTRAEWLAKMGNRYPTMWIGAATMRMTPQELTDMAQREPDAIAEMISSILDLRETLEAETEVMKAAGLRLLAGCARAGLV